MKKLAIIIVCLPVAFITTGCKNTKTRAVEGAIIGGVLGAGAGGIIGHQGHHGAEGAGIGAAVGAVTGAIIGSQIEKPNQAATVNPASNPNQMTMQQIVELSKQGANENVIIDKILLSNSRFNLNDADITYLKEQGVSQRVIDAMQGK